MVAALGCMVEGRGSGSVFSPIRTQLIQVFFLSFLFRSSPFLFSLLVHRPLKYHPSPPTTTTTNTTTTSTTTTFLPPNLLPSYCTRRTSAEDVTQPTGSPLPRPSAPELSGDSAPTPILSNTPKLTKRRLWPEGNPGSRREICLGARGSGTNKEIIGML